MIKHGNGYNVSLGGEFNGCKYFNIIYCFDVEGNFVEKYYGSRDILEKIEMSDSALWQALHGIRNGSHYSHGYIWYLENDISDIDMFKKSFDKTMYNKHRALYQFSKNGELVGTYNNAAEAHSALNVENKNQILDCANNKLRTAFGYYWRYVGDIDDLENFINTFDFESQFKSLKTIQSDHVLVYSNDHTLLKEYNSIKEAGAELNI